MATVYLYSSINSVAKFRPFVAISPLLLQVLSDALVLSDVAPPPAEGDVVPEEKEETLQQRVAEALKSVPSDVLAGQVLVPESAQSGVPALFTAARSAGAIAHQFDLSFSKVGNAVFLRLADLSASSPVVSVDFIKFAGVIPAAYRPRANQWVDAGYAASKTKQAALVHANGDLWLAASAKGEGLGAWAPATPYQGGEVSLMWVAA
jgi:hypothetical protein